VRMRERAIRTGTASRRTSSCCADLTPQIREWFRDHNFTEEHFDAPDHAMYAVGVHRFAGARNRSPKAKSCSLLFGELLEHTSE